MASGSNAALEPFGRDEGRRVFGPVADAYTAARPDYPERVFEVLQERCGLGRGSRVLEIGAGSGQATRRLAEAGGRVVAVEPSEITSTPMVTAIYTARRPG